MKIARGIWLLGLVCTTAGACNKKNGGGGYNNGGEQREDTSGTVIVTPADPNTAGTIGFFMDGWMQRKFTAPAFTEKAPPSAAAYTVTVDASTVLTKISPALFGNNTNIWMTQMTNQPKLITHLSNLNPGILRFPGGNNSSVYFWNSAGWPPADAPPKLQDANGAEIDAGYWFGGNTAEWTMSVDNYYRVLQQTGTEGIITVNYGYARYGTGADPVAAAAHLAADWVRADKGRTRYWEVGNESNGTWQAGYRIDQSKNKDGQPQIVTGELYGKHFKVFADSMRKAAAENGKPIFIGVQLLEHEPANWATPTDREWNNGVLKQAGTAADYYIIHSYYTAYNTNSNPPEVLASAEAVTKAMADHVTAAIARAGVPVKPLALTEWNIFAVGSQQMVSQVAGMHAVLVIGELMRNRYGLACRWDLANAWDNGNDHGLFSQGEPASGEQKWDPRPAFYYLYYFRQFVGDRFINAEVSGANSGINAYASTFSSGEAGVTLVNKSSSARDVQLAFKNFKPGGRYYWYVLTGGDGVSSFSRKVFINGSGPSGIAGGPADYATLKAFSATAAQGVKVSLPPMSVVCMVVEPD
ncbi:alpha-L-arabinofuranosidase [Chitinophaga sp. GCM10012297]|uniref:Alpha-L-arabinofuranosidase 1 catalytic domain-containing protein n=1 Tax=Chitinophaga chungangae TaxID=2821488 RepID=A0ABS3YAL5_9BACT|nr:hypothetical protein [Chitinophaga chungangae]MBO9151722.1 hypothetical protein [Chitinophaga chungangae]